MNPNNRSFISRRAPISVGGFTLIELLTVIAVIGILVAIIVPVTGRVRASAKQSACLSNLRQIHVASLLFANDHKGVLPMRDEDETPPGQEKWNNWHRYLVPYLQGQNDAAKWRDNDAVFICPADTLADPRLTYSYNGRLKSKRVLQLDPNVLLIAEGYSSKPSTLGKVPTAAEEGLQERHSGKGYILRLSGATSLFTRATLPTQVQDPKLWGP